MDDPTPLPIPFPVDFGPTITDWLLVALTLLSVVASSVVAVMAYLGARDAKKLAQQASDSEKARQERDDAEKALARADQVRRAYAKHLSVLGRHASDLAEYRGRQPGFPSPRRLSDPKDPAPDGNAVLADLHVLRLFVPEDAAELAAVFDLENKMQICPRLADRHASVVNLITWLTEWRLGRMTSTHFIKFVAREARRIANPPDEP